MIVIAVCFEFLLHVLHVLLIAVVYPLVYLKKCYDVNSFVLQLVNWALLLLLYLDNLSNIYIQCWLVMLVVP